MLTASLKLTDIVSRSLFVLGGVYLLPVRESGQFGLLITVIGFYSFYCGFECYKDLQRRISAIHTHQANALLLENVKFFIVNHIVGIPVLAMVLHYWVGLNGNELVSALVISVGEHVANEVYRISLIMPRYRVLIGVAIVKNLSILFVLSALFLFIGEKIEFSMLLAVWATVSVVATMASVLIFSRLIEPYDNSSSNLRGIKYIYYGSLANFGIGLIAILSSQVDRLLVGGLMPLESSGIYFRHLFLATAFYQLAGVVSHNRIMAGVYRWAGSSEMHAVRGLVASEMRRLFFVSILIIGAILALGQMRGLLPVIQTLKAPLLASLVLIYVLKLLADYNSIVLTAVHRERVVLFAQIALIATVAILSLILVPKLELGGVVLASCIGTALYAGILTFSTRKLY